MTIPKSIADDPDVFVPTEVAEALGVHRGTVWNWIQSGLLKASRRGTRGNFYAVSRSNLERFLSIYTVAIKDPTYLERRSVLRRRNAAQLASTEARRRSSLKRSAKRRTKKKPAKKAAKKGDAR